jgi:hypothetical protein
MQERTVRELAGEIWSELIQKQLFDIASFSKFKDNADLLEQSVDLVLPFYLKRSAIGFLSHSSLL